MGYGTFVRDEGEAVEEEGDAWFIADRRCVREEETEFGTDVVIRAVVGGEIATPIVDVYLAVERTPRGE